jgi:hypothetical protein
LLLVLLLSLVVGLVGLLGGGKSRRGFVGLEEVDKDLSRALLRCEDGRGQEEMKHGQLLR